MYEPIIHRPLRFDHITDLWGVRRGHDVLRDDGTLSGAGTGKGPLANLNDGGVGNHGHVRSEEAKRHHSEMMKGRPKSEAHKKQIGDLRRGIPKSPEYRLKISAGVKKAHADGRLTSLCKDPRARALKAWETKRARYGTELPWSKTKGKT